MNSIGFPTPTASNSAFIANPATKQAVGQEDIDTKNDIFRAVEETSETSASKTSPDSNAPANNDKSQSVQQQELAVIRDLANRDREVRAHEQAHAAVGGQYAGAANYTYERGPNGVSYAVGGEVSISAPTGGDPKTTLQAAEQIKRAALAPTDPSAQDRGVAAQASLTATQANAEIATLKSDERVALASDEKSTSENGSSSKSQADTETDAAKSDNNSSTQAFKNITNASDVGFILNQLA